MRSVMIIIHHHHPRPRGQAHIMLMLLRHHDANDSLPIHGIEHLNDNKHRQGHGGWLRAFKNIAIQPLKPLILNQALCMMCLKQQSN